MTVEQFIDRLKKILDTVNNEQIEGQNQLLLSEDDEILLRGETTVENAILRAKTLNSAIGVYADFAADPSNNLQDFASTDASFSAAEQQIMSGFGVGPSYLGVTGEYVPPQGGTDFYTEDDNITLFAGKPTEEIAGIQADLVNSGLLELGAFRPGDWDLRTQRAFAVILARANRLGVTPEQKVNGSRWKEVLLDYSQNPTTVVKPEAVYLPPDYDAVTQQVKGLFRQQLDRDPKAYEMKLLGDVLMAESKKAFELQQQLQADLDVDVTSQELLEGTYGNHITPEVEPGTTEVSPSATLYEKFDEITAKEQERLGRNRDIQATNRIITNAFTGGPR